jgi:hypothetical protein
MPASFVFGLFFHNRRFWIDLAHRPKGIKRIADSELGAHASDWRIASQEGGPIIDTINFFVY